MRALKSSAWPWFVLGVVLVVIGLVVLDGAGGAIVLAVGLLAIFGAGVRVISRNDSTPPDDRRVPAGRSGV
ncbi:MAG TPA: hypothetical protein VFP78_22510 [Solirubrobacteraceae bacterium]|nr:hypothetical protein [Solirubrobacteraceae bacterium]